MERAQAHTLEAFTAAILLIGGVLFALQATAVTPLSASTSNQFVENQQRTLANDLLATAAENGTLLEAVVYWNSTSETFAGAEDGMFRNGGPPNAFGRRLNQTFRDKRIAFNVHVTYWTGTGFSRIAMVFMGSPSDNAVVASRMISIYNDTQLSAPGATQNVSTAWANGAFYADDTQIGGELFNVLEVRLVIWRM